MVSNESLETHPPYMKNLFIVVLGIKNLCFESLAVYLRYVLEKGCRKFWLTERVIED